MSKTIKRNAATGEWMQSRSGSGILRELKAGAAELKNQVKKESKVFSKFSLNDGGKKLAS